MRPDSTITAKISKILLYNDTRFFELMSGLTAVAFGIVLATMGNQSVSPALILAYKVLYPYWWAAFFIGGGMVQVLGSVSNDDRPRLMGSGFAIALWSFWALASLHSKGVFWPIMAFLALKLAWVIFRVLIDRERPALNTSV